MSDPAHLAGAAGHAGAPPTRRLKPVPPLDPTPSPRELDDRARLAEEVRGSLEKIQKTAENWRTGVAGLTTLVTATLLFKGRDAITDYETWVRVALGLLALLSLGLAIASLWLFLTAAYGRVRRVSTQSVIDEGGVDARNVHLATTALDDLRFAKGLAIASAALLAAALLLSWYGPAAPGEPLAFARLGIRGDSAAAPAETVCGELTAEDGTTTVLKVAGEPDARRIATGRLVSLVLVAKC
jgi:hypothetical protein